MKRNFINLTVFLSVFVFFAVSGAFAQVTYDNNAVSGAANAGTFTTLPNLTVPAGEKALLVVMIRNDNSIVPNNVVFGPQFLPLTLLQTASNSTVRQHIYYLVLGDLAAPTTGKVQILYSSPPAIITAVAFSLKNVNQSAPLISPQSKTFTPQSGGPSLNVTGLLGDMVIDSIGAVGDSSGVSPTFSASNGQPIVATTTAVSGGQGTRFSVSRQDVTTSSTGLGWSVNYPSIFSTGLGIQHMVKVQSANKVYKTFDNGNWNNSAIWVTSTVPPATVAAGSRIIIQAGATLNVDYTIAAGANLEIAAAGALTVPAGRTLTNNGNLKNAGTLTVNGTVSDAGTTTFEGAAAQTLIGSTTPSFNRLVINNAAGVTFNTSAKVSDSLTLNGGNVTVSGSSVLTIGPLGSITRNSGYIIGTIKKEYAGIGNFIYPVGTTAGYTPVTVMVDTLGGGDFSVKSNDGFLAGTDTAQSLQRNWDLTANGLNHVDLTLTYLDTDVPAGANEANLKFVRRTGTRNVDTAPTSLDNAANTATLDGITAFSKWGLGTSLSPSAASVSVAGRVTTDNGNGLVNATVIMTDSTGTTRITRTSSFGYYRFDGVEAGRTYIVSVSSKRYRFTPKAVTVAGELTDLDFTGLGSFSEAAIEAIPGAQK